MLLVVKTGAVFDFSSFPAFATFIAFDIVKVSLVATLYFLTDCLKIMRKEAQISRALIFFSKPIRKTNIGRSYVSISAVALLNSTIP